MGESGRPVAYVVGLVTPGGVARAARHSKTAASRNRTPRRSFSESVGA